MRECSVATKLKQGRGVIDLEHPESYKPWIYTRECTSGSGRRYTIQDLYYPKRIIHLLSDLEYATYFLLRRNRKVKELFEQVPLNQNITLEICERMHVRHPKHPRTQENIVMTTDFVIFFNDETSIKTMAIAVKPKESLENQRTLEKLQVEKAYWTGKGTDWAIMTEDGLRY